MPLKLKTPCRHPGCGRPTRERFCPEHQHLVSRRPADRWRGTAAERGYDCRWQRLRAWYINQHPLCEDCLDEGVLNAAPIEVDHVIPISVRPDLRLVASNLRSRCRRHHSRKTEQDRKQYGDQLGDRNRRG